MLLYLTNWYLVTIYTCTCIRPVKYPNAETWDFMHGHHIGENVGNWFNFVWNFDNNDETVVTLVQWHCTYLLNYHTFLKGVLSKKKVHFYTSLPPFFLIKFLQLMQCVYKSRHFLINSYNKTSVIYSLSAVTTMWSWL